MKTHGLGHVALAVRDVQRSLAFYNKVLGMVPVYEEEDSIQAQTPGTRDVLVFERDPARAGKRGGVAHFGFPGWSSRCRSRSSSAGSARRAARC
ncbi:MAG: VOC family protein [Steroidobacteraceae bacterium]